MPEAESNEEPRSAADTERDRDEAPLDWANTEAIEQSPVGKRLVALARATWIDRATRSPEEVKKLAAELGVSEADAVTPMGNAILVLGRGPEDDAETTLGRSLIGLALARAWQAPDADDAKLASTAIALSARSPFDVLGSIDRLMAPERAWRAVAARVRKFDRGETKTMSRGEAVLACAALFLSTSTAADVARKGLQLANPLLVAILGRREPSGEAVTSRLSGELLPAPRSSVVTALLAVTGVLFALHVLRIVARVVLVYRTPAEVTLSPTGVRVRSKTTVLGRTLRETETRIPRESLTKATREIRFPRLGLYAGLLALALGSYVGVSTLSDGVRSSSLSLLLTGLVIVAAGIGLDLLLTSAAPGARGRCRVLFVAEKGRSICIGGVDAARADEALDVLKA